MNDFMGNTKVFINAFSCKKTYNFSACKKILQSLSLLLKYQDFFLTDFVLMLNV